jgi:tryptophan synthase alpha chain
MTDRLVSRFARLKSENRAGLIAYVMGGDPDWDSSLSIAHALAEAGADVIELGFPFTDPMADGPAIQAASERALAGGANVITVLQLCAEFRRKNKTTPVVLMGYLNPVEQMGAGGFAAAAAAAGVDGVILVDLPPEEDADYRDALSAMNLDLIRLAAPTTDDHRLTTVLEGASGFIYYVSVAGVTGQKAAPAEASALAVARLRARTSLPIAVGFGVRDAASAAAIAAHADAVVMGSALVDRIAAGASAGKTGEVLANEVAELARTVSLSIRSAQRTA